MESSKCCIIAAVLSFVGGCLLVAAIGYGYHENALREHDAQCRRQIEQQASVINQAGGTWNKIKSTFGAGGEASQTTQDTAAQ